MSASVFRNKFSEDIFNYKYRHEGCETWEKLAAVLVEDVCRQWMTDDEKEALTQAVAQMKFIPGGRYIYYAGRPIKAFNNCFSGDTLLLTDKGFKHLQDVANTNVRILSPVDGEYKEVMVHHHGVQPVQEITFAPVRGNSQITYKVKATRTHHWLLADGTDTYDIRVGDVVPANTQSHDSALGFIHGLIFGDGTKEYERVDGSQVHKIRLCGHNCSTLPKLARHLEECGIEFSVTTPDSYNGDPLVRIQGLTNLKDLPETDDPAYIAGFLRGWIDADGSERVGKKLCSVNESAIDYFISHAPLAGLVVTGEKRSQVRDTAFAKNHRIFTINYAYAEDWGGFKVKEIKQLGEQDVYCPFEPQYQQIVISHGIRTFNCYLLRAESDTREDWAMLSWKAESCLATGGGIGVDYSIYRPKGTPLKRTGGEASGPVSKMRMINEIGREVMQGGSRRSAIYASLNWQHQDIKTFLYAKDWHSMKVPGTDKTVWDCKVADFNYPAPLDMTNISANYDDAWLNLPDRHNNEIFKINCRQAMETGEPGWSFNFGDKQNETLRNACTEVTSEDDSDVCNLGSLNMSRIETAEEFRQIVELATKFLICGTMVAHLPYEKVYDVRAKNRRLGLGLMGMHEWLVQRGDRYEVTPELHKWLAIYRDESDAVAKSFSAHLSISEPVAKRAIAPTGSIGILAGTTTGIEPVFAVAYKRRYLKNGTQWHYQYVVDSAAKDLIERYGVDPHKIESAIDLAKDYERRLKFQADTQDYVDQSISSTINMPSWGSELNNEDKIDDFALTLSKYAPRLRGFTVYPDGARGGQPLVSVDYDEAAKQQGVEYLEHDVCVIGGKGGTCGS